MKPKSVDTLGVYRRKIPFQFGDFDQLLKTHFPDASASELYPLASDLLNSRNGRFVDHEEEKARLNRINDAATQLWNEYNQLPSRLKSRMNSGAHFEGEEDVAPITFLLRQVLYELTGEDPWRDLLETGALLDVEGAIDRAKKALSWIEAQSTQQRLSEANAKVHFAMVAKMIWEECSGKKAPVEPSISNEPGHFYAFLFDLIELCGKKWSVKRTLGASRKAVPTDT